MPITTSSAKIYRNIGGWKIGKVYDNVSLFLHKCKYDGAQWIYHCTIYERQREVSFKRYLLKQSL